MGLWESGQRAVDTWRVRQVLWLWKMAWRDSRGGRKRLLLAMAAISVGMAAFIAITAFDANVRDAVHNQAKSLLGADLVFSSRQPFAPETEALLATLGGEQSRAVSCTSMAYFPKSADSRLVQVRALEGSFPYYGALETEPPAAASAFRADLQAIVDDGLLLQFDAQVGDTIKIGALTLPIAGRLKKIPGEAVATALIKPRVYMPMAALQQTELLHKGSMVTYKVYVKLPPEVDAETLLETLHPHLSTYRLTGETARQRAASVGRVMTNLSRFLHLVGFIAVLLGGVGVASAIQVYIKDKLNTVAILRCIGARAPQALAVYVLQATVLGAIGAMVGGAGGLAVQLYLPRLLHDFLPVTMPLAIAWPAVLRGLGIGVGLVAPVRPLAAPRGAAGDPLAGSACCLQRASTRRTRSLALGVLVLIVGSIGAFAFIHTERWTYGVGFCAALGVAFGLLTVAGKTPHAARQNFLYQRVALRVASRAGESPSPPEPDPGAGVGPRLRDIFAHDTLFDPADAAASRRACRCRRATEHDLVRYSERSAR